MAIVKKIDLKLKIEMDQCVQFQILTYSFFEDIQITNSDLKLLSELAITGDVELTKFCIELVKLNIFKSPQSARNSINKVFKKGLLVKKGKNKKLIQVNPALNIQKDGLVLLDYKILGNESKITQGI